MTILAAPRPTVQQPSALDVEALALVARYCAEARAGVAQLLADLDDAALVDDAEGYTAHRLGRVGVGARS